MKHSKVAVLASAPLLLMGIAACGSDDPAGESDKATGSGKLVQELDCAKIQSLDAHPVLGTSSAGNQGSDECEVEGPDLRSGEQPDRLVVALMQAPATLEEFLSTKGDSYEVDTEPEANRTDYLIFQKDHWTCDEATDYGCDAEKQAQQSVYADVSIDSITGIVYRTIDGSAERMAEGFTVNAPGWTYTLQTAVDDLGDGLNFYFVQEDGSTLRCTYDYSAKGHGQTLYTQPQDDGLLYWEQPKQAEALEWCNQALAASRD